MEDSAILVVALAVLDRCDWKFGTSLHDFVFHHLAFVGVQVFLPKPYDLGSNLIRFKCQQLNIKQHNIRICFQDETGIIVRTNGKPARQLTHFL